jgi:hypothetical protein
MSSSATAPAVPIGSGAKPLSLRTIQRLGKHVTGDGNLTKYRSGPALVELFNTFGCEDVYGQGFPSTWSFAEDRLRALNGTTAIASLIEAVFDPLEFKLPSGEQLSPEVAVADLNEYLRRDGMEIVLGPNGAKFRMTSGAPIVLGATPAASAASQTFIAEHVEKCESKLRDGDFAGAITNARSLCEDVLIDIERQRVADAPAYDGDLPKLFKRVRRALNADPDTYDKQEAVVQLIRGLTTVVDGLAGMSNGMGDRHGGRRVKPKLHYAQLAVNAANTLCSFVLESHAQQPLAETTSGA